MKCWMVWFHEEACEPIWAESEEKAVAAYHAANPKRPHDIEVDDLRRVEAWDTRDPESITDRDWYDLDDGYGRRCVVCEQFAFTESGQVWWTLEGKPVHGPGNDFWGDECYLETVAVPRDILELIEGKDKQIVNLSSCWREANRRIGALADSAEALRELFETATGTTPEAYLGVKETL